jgi:hypothetical protein
MKKYAYKSLFLTLIIIVCGLNIYAQQKASDRPFTTELKKLKEIQETRKKMLQQTQQPSENKETQTTTNSDNKTKQPAASKSSLQPMAIPVRSKKQ